MENILCTFPHIFQQILDKLDQKSLAGCRLVEKSWLYFVDNSKTNWIRMIKELTEDQGKIGEKTDISSFPYKIKSIQTYLKEDPDQGM